MSDLQALILLLVTTALTAGVLVVGIREASKRRPRSERAEGAQSWQPIAVATWPAAWGMPTTPPPPAEPGEPTLSGHNPDFDSRWDATHGLAHQPEGGVSR